MADNNQWTAAGSPEPLPSGWEAVGAPEPLQEEKPSLLKRAWGALNYPLGHLLPGWEKESQNLTEGANEEAVKAGQTMDQRSNTFFPSVSDLHLLKGTALATERDLPDALATPLSIATMGLGGLATKDLGLLSKFINPAARVAGATAIGQGGYDLAKTRHESLLDPAADLQRANDLLNIVMGGAGEIAAQRASNAARDIKAGRYSQPAPEEGIKPGAEPEPEVEAQQREPEEAPQAQTPQSWEPAGKPEPIEPEKVAAVQQATEQHVPGFAELPHEEKQAAIAKDIVNNQQQAQVQQDYLQAQGIPAGNPMLTNAENQIRTVGGRLTKIGKVLAAGDEADLSDKSMQDATGRVLQDMLDRHFSEAERQAYKDARGRTSKAKALTPSEEAAKAAAMPEQPQAADPVAGLEQYVADNDLEQQVRQETVKRFVAEVGQAGLKDRAALRQYATENRPQIMEAVAARHAEVSGLAAPSLEAQKQAAEQLAKEGEMPLARSAADAGMVRAEGMTAEKAKAIVRETRLNAFKREGTYYRNVLKRVLLPQWQEALASGGESTFTPEELKGFPAEVRNALVKELNAKKSAGAAPSKESVGAVVPKPVEAAAAAPETAAEPATRPQEGVEVKPAAPETVTPAPQAQTPPQTPAQAPPTAAPPAGTAQATPPAAGLPPTPPPKPPAPATPPPAQPGQPYDLERLIQEISTHPEVKRSIMDRLSVPMKNAAVEWNSLKNKVSQAYTFVKWSAANAWQSYRHPLDWTDFDSAVGHYSGNNQVLADGVRRFVKTLLPRTDALTREGMANYLDMGGDLQKLQHAAANTTNEKLKAGYEKALALTPDQRAMLDKVHQFQEWERDEAMKAGVLNTAVQDYIMHIWERPNATTDRIMANLNFGELQVNPTFARKRVFDTYFEGEQKGFTPSKKDVGYLIAAHHMAFGRAVSGRGFIRELSGGNARDGRPNVAVSGIGVPVQDPVSGAENYLIKPNALRAIPATTTGAAQTQALINSGKLIMPTTPDGKVKIDVSDYMTIDHPALRGWKWVGKAEDGSIMLQGDLKVHPEVYQKLKNILSRSAISSNKYGRAILSTSTMAKHTLLTLSAFHQVQEGVHAAGHGVNPFAPAKLDLADPTQRFLVDHGVMVSDFGAQQAFSEGVGSTGLLKYVPYLGEYMHAYQDYLFRDYIPRLKMDMAVQAYRRNTARYAGKLSKDQIGALTARQANAAFGGLNYKLLGRNPTFQDVLRLTLLAPDFMEARMRFGAQAMMPGGTEQLHALLKIAGVQYIGARIINYMINKDPKMDPQDAFRIVAGGKSYQLRSVPGDMIDALYDERRFVQHRANPLTVRPMVELFTGRDEFGRTRTASEIALDYARNIVPIPLQGPVKKGDQDLADTISTALGVQRKQYHTPSEQRALNYLQQKPFSGNDDPAKFEQQRAFAKIREGLRDGSVSWEQVFKLQDQGKLSETQVSNLARTVNMSNLQRWTNALEVPQAMDVFKHATPAEKDELYDLIQDKISKEIQDPQEQDRLFQELDRLHAEKPLIARLRGGV